MDRPAMPDAIHTDDVASRRRHTKTGGKRDQLDFVPLALPAAVPRGTVCTRPHRDVWAVRLIGVFTGRRLFVHRFDTAVHHAALGVALTLGVSAVHAQVAIVSPTYIDFGEVKMGALVSAPVELRNLTASPLSIAGGGVSGGPGLSSNGGTCTNPIPANGSCAFNYTFQPRSATETVVGTTSIFLSGGGQSLSTRIDVRGTGGESLVQVTPRIIDFGEELIGETVTVPVFVTNTHSATVQFAGGGIGAPFGGGTSCGGGLPPGATCQFNYRFTPAQINEAVGSTSFSASATSPALSQGYSIQLRGRGRTTAGRYHVAPVALDFGDIKIGTQVESLVTSKNRTASTMTRAGGGFNDNDNAFSSFGSSVPACGGGALPPAVSCSSTYLFLPRERRGHLANTRIGYSQLPNFYEEVPLEFTGNGVGTLARVSPVDFDFGDIGQGTFVTVPVRILNTSPVTLTNFLGGNVTGAFSRTSTCGTTLTVGASCTLTYRFQPGSADNFMATTFLSYQGNGAVETTQITLSGTSGSAIFVDGFDP